MKLFYCLLLFLIILITSCSSWQSVLSLSSRESTNQSIPSQSPLQAVTLEPGFKKAIGQVIYVPTYSHIYYENPEKYLDLAITLSIRNTDLEHSIILTSVRYYDTNGKLLKEYLANPMQLPKLASGEFIVNRTDRTGGSGANFIVEWVSDRKVAEPIVEAVMISAVGNQSISFVSSGKVIKTLP